MKKFLILVCVVLLMFVFVNGVFKLDSCYQDKDGDLIVDIFSVELEQLDFFILIFVYIFVEDLVVYWEVWLEFLDYLFEVMGKWVQFFLVQFNVVQIEVMCVGCLYIVGFNIGFNLLVVVCVGYCFFIMMVLVDGFFGYEMEILSYLGFGIEKVEDICGKEMVFMLQIFNFGFKVLFVILKVDYNMIVGEDFELVFFGKYDNFIFGVVNQDYQVVVVVNLVLN